MSPEEQVPELIEALKPYVSQVAEVQLLDYSARAQYGPWAKFRYLNADSLKGYEQGQRFHLILIAITEAEMPAALEGKERKPYRLSQLAGMLCNEEDFRRWVTETYGEPCHDKDEAAQWLREATGVESRAYLDSNEAAAEIFRDIVREYDLYKQQPGEQTT